MRTINAITSSVEPKARFTYTNTEGNGISVEAIAGSGKAEAR